MTQRVLTAVYNPIEFDGRVLRAVEALLPAFEVEVICPAGVGGEEAAPFRVHRVHLPTGRVRRLSAFSRAVVQCARERRPDIVYAHDFFMAAPGVVAATAVGSRLVYDAHELSIPRGLVSTNVRELTFYAGESVAVRCAALVIAANRPRADAMAKHYGIDTPLVIRNIPPSPSVSPVDVTFAPPTIVYQGDISLSRGLARWIAAFALLPREFRLLVVGGGPDLEALEIAAARSDARERITFTGKVARRELTAILSSCAVGILSYTGSDPTSYFCAPNKIFEYAQLGLPMVGLGSPILCELIDAPGIGIGLVSEEGTPEALAQAIRSAYLRREGISRACLRFAAANPWGDEATKLLDAFVQLRDSA